MTFWDGAGNIVRVEDTFSGTDLWQQERDANKNIEADRHDAHDQAMADSIQACLAKNGENAATNNLPMGGFKHTGVANASAGNHYGVVNQIQNGSYVYAGSSTGSSNAYAISLSIPVTAYVTGARFQFVANFTNTGATTININGVGAIALKTMAGVALAGGEIQSGQLVDFILSATNEARIVSQPAVANALLQATATSSWTPTITPNVGTWTPSTTNCKYVQVGNLVFFRINITGVISGTTNTVVALTMPGSITAPAVDQWFSAEYSTGGSPSRIGIQFKVNNTGMSFERETNGVFQTTSGSTDVGFAVTGWFEKA